MTKSHFPIFTIKPQKIFKKTPKYRLEILKFKWGIRNLRTSRSIVRGIQGSSECLKSGGEGFYFEEVSVTPSYLFKI